MKKRSILISMLVIGVVAALIAAATTATFSDEVTSNGNTFTAGTLYMSVDGECGVTGDDATGSDRTGQYGIGGLGGDGVGGASDICNDDQTASFTASDMIPSDTVTTAHTFHVVNQGSVAGNLTATVSATPDGAHSGCTAFTATPASLASTQLGPHGGGSDSHDFVVTVSLPSSAGNECQGAVLTVSVTFDLVQA